MNKCDRIGCNNLAVGMVKTDWSSLNYCELHIKEYEMLPDFKITRGVL